MHCICNLAGIAVFTLGCHRTGTCSNCEDFCVAKRHQVHTCVAFLPEPDICIFVSWIRGVRNPEHLPTKRNYSSVQKSSAVCLLISRYIVRTCALLYIEIYLMWNCNIKMNIFCRARIFARILLAMNANILQCITGHAVIALGGFNAKTMLLWHLRWLLQWTCVQKCCPWRNVVRMLTEKWIIALI